MQQIRPPPPQKKRAVQEGSAVKDIRVSRTRRTGLLIIVLIVAMVALVALMGTLMTLDAGNVVPKDTGIMHASMVTGSAIVPDVAGTVD
jgi:hypothetical protein